MSTNQKNNDEEVDLGSLFVIIGNGFRNFFNFIGNIFIGIFECIIAILLFLKKNTIKIGVALVLGAILGFFLQTQKSKSFGSDLLVEPNFKSTLQLYNNIQFYNDLVLQKDTMALVKVFNLDKESAGGLQKFSIEAIANENDIINSYNEFILEVDTATVSSYTFAEFKNAFTDLDYKFHKISVVSEQKDVFPKLGEVIISSVVENPYFNRVKNLKNENLNRTDSIFIQNISQLDSLRKVYMQVMVEEAKKSSNGTNIDLGGTKKETKELEIFNTKRRIIRDLKEISEEKSQKYEVINVISNFQPVGYEISGVTKNYIFILGLLGAGVMIGVLLLLQLNTYLNNYKK
ncbi:hypothetical protein [uncultured Polaribacter sp.]|uniref:hypothetical protein n=1 Tax=uncultured Polaribacter sp. TaxID=174711 RepID=UPI002604594F|nr:hypothetical protein [uncultured Polaribacter sp.]